MTTKRELTDDLCGLIVRVEQAQLKLADVSAAHNVPVDREIAALEVVVTRLRREANAKRRTMRQRMGWA